MRNFQVQAGKRRSNLRKIGSFATRRAARQAAEYILSRDPDRKVRIYRCVGAEGEWEVEDDLDAPPSQVDRVGADG